MKQKKEESDKKSAMERQEQSKKRQEQSKKSQEQSKKRQEQSKKRQEQSKKREKKASEERDKNREKEHSESLATTSPQELQAEMGHTAVSNISTSYRVNDEINEAVNRVAVANAHVERLVRERLMNSSVVELFGYCNNNEKLCTSALASESGGILFGLRFQEVAKRDVDNSGKIAQAKKIFASMLVQSVSTMIHKATGNLQELELSSLFGNGTALFKQSLSALPAAQQQCNDAWRDYENKHCDATLAAATRDVENLADVLMYQRNSIVSQKYVQCKEMRVDFIKRKHPKLIRDLKAFTKTIKRLQRRMNRRIWEFKRKEIMHKLQQEEAKRQDRNSEFETLLADNSKQCETERDQKRDGIIRSCVEDRILLNGLNCSSSRPRCQQIEDTCNTFFTRSDPKKQLSSQMASCIHLHRELDYKQPTCICPVDGIHFCGVPQNINLLNENVVNGLAFKAPSTPTSLLEMERGQYNLSAAVSSVVVTGLDNFTSLKAWLNHTVTLNANLIKMENEDGDMAAKVQWEGRIPTEHGRTLRDTCAHLKWSVRKFGMVVDFQGMLFSPLRLAGNTSQTGRDSGGRRRRRLLQRGSVRGC